MEEVSADDIKIETVQMDPNTFKTMKSSETKRQQNYKFYNNTYMYVSFREKFVLKPDQVDESGERKSVRDLFKSNVVDYLVSAQGNEDKLKGVNLKNISLR